MKSEQQHSGTPNIHYAFFSRGRAQAERVTSGLITWATKKITVAGSKFVSAFGSEVYITTQLAGRGHLFDLSEKSPQPGSECG